VSETVTVPRGALEAVLRMTAVDMHNPCKHTWRCEVGDAVERLHGALESQGQWYVQYRYAEGMTPHVFHTGSLEMAQQLLASVPAEIMETNVPPTTPRRLSGHPCDHCGAGEKEWCRDECVAVDEGDWR
jgi:hypothetical protein